MIDFLRRNIYDGGVFMFCPYCGKDAGESNFCPNCGKDLRNFDYSMIKRDETRKDDSFTGKVNEKIKKAMTTRDKRDIIAAVIGILIMVVYTLLPTDVIPDLIPPLGWLDDGIVDAGTLAMIISRIISYKKRNK